MKLIISQIVEFEGENFPYSWRKEIETDIIPHKGDFIEDPLWKEPGEYEVVETLQPSIFDGWYFFTHKTTILEEKGRIRLCQTQNCLI